MDQLVPASPVSSTLLTLFYKAELPVELQQMQSLGEATPQSDIMGFEKDTDRGVHVDDVILALKGHVEENHQFNPTQRLKKGNNGYRSSPTLSDRVHVLVCVIPADQLSIMSDEVVKKMREVRLAANELGIPQLAIITKADLACPKVGENVNNAYKSIYLKEQVDKVSTLLGIPQNSIFLVKNYDPEPTISDDMNALIINALRQMITFGDDFLSDLGSFFLCAVRVPRTEECLLL